MIRLKDGESMAALCREFQISRRTGYKIFERYEECGLEGLTDRAWRPHRYANQLPAQIEAHGRGLKAPVVSIKSEEAGHTSSSVITRQKLNWHPPGYDGSPISSKLRYHETEPDIPSVAPAKAAH
jgi:hypothetical protein